MESNALKQKIAPFIGSEIVQVEKMRGGASPREFWKVTLQPPHYFPGDELLVMVYPEDYARSLQDYMDVDYYLKRMGIPTPRLYEIWQEGHMLFLEFVDAPTLEEWINQRQLDVGLALRSAVDFLQQIQQQCQYEAHCPAFRRPMDADFFRFELDHHFRLHVLDRFFQRPLTAAETRAVTQLEEWLLATLVKPPTVFVHRDYQSSNLMAYFNGQDRIHFKLIDFQDARYGSPLYDLVSLLWDSYLTVPEALREELLGAFFEYQRELPGGVSSRDAYLEACYAFAIQRKLHDAGAFSKNYQRVGNSNYYRYILPTLEMVVALLEHFPQFREVQAIFQERLAGVKS